MPNSLTHSHRAQRSSPSWPSGPSNLFIFHTAIGMTRAPDGIAADSLGDTISALEAGGLSPYRTDHINRFGNYVLDCRTRPRRCPSHSRNGDKHAAER